MTDNEEYQGNPADWIAREDVKSYVNAPARKNTHLENNGLFITTPENTPTIIWLCDYAGILEGYHRDCGLSFKNLVDCSEGRMIAANNELSEYNESSQQKGAALKVTAVYMQLTKLQKANVCMVVFEELKVRDRGYLFQIAPRIIDAFESLWNAMKNDNVEYAIARLQKTEIDKRNRSVTIHNSTDTRSVSKISQPIVIHKKNSTKHSVDDVFVW